MTCCTCKCKGYHSNSNSPSWVHEWEHEVTGVMETNYKYSKKQEKSGLCESQSWSLLIGGTGQILLKEAKPLATPPPSDMLFFLGEIATAPSTKWKKTSSYPSTSKPSKYKKRGKSRQPTWNTPISLPWRLQFCELLDFPPSIPD